MRVVTPRGNLKAKKAMAEVFKVRDALWRGLGEIPRSGLQIKDEFSQFDTEKKFSLNHKPQATKM
jgi:hydrogenase expression/formation protein HypD